MQLAAVHPALSGQQAGSLLPDGFTVPRYSARRYQTYYVRTVPSDLTLVLTAVNNPSLAADPFCRAV